MTILRMLIITGGLFNLLHLYGMLIASMMYVYFQFSCRIYVRTTMCPKLSAMVGAEDEDQIHPCPEDFPYLIGYIKIAK